MNWLSIIEFGGRYLLPSVIVIILAMTRVMRLRYSLTFWGGLVIIDYLSTFIPTPATMWPPTFLLAIAFVGYALEAGTIVFLLLFVIWRSERRKWQDQYPTRYVVGQDAWPALKREPSRQFRSFVSALASKS